MADIGSTISQITPKFTGIGNILIYVFIAVLFLVGVALTTFFIIKRLKYNKKIIIFERIGHNFEPTRKDIAMEVKLSREGDTIFYLKKNKKYLPNPTIQTGRRVYWYFIREDGEWINFGTGDFDEESKKLGAFFLDKEMRFARTQIGKGLKERYDKPSFWAQHGAMILSLAFIALIGILAFILMGRFIDLTGKINNIIQSIPTLMEKANQILGSLDNICSGGSGLK